MEESKASDNSPREKAAADLESLWQFGGHRLSSGEFNTAMVHFYRAEITRANTWRNRIDMTTNWAVITAGAALSISFGNAANSPSVLILVTLLVVLFLFIEARRYRYYELWASRVRIMEQNFFAGLLSPPFLPHSDWADRLTESLRNPTFPISLLEAFGRRYRRNYAPIFLILALSYIVKVVSHPTMSTNWNVIQLRMAIGPIPGLMVLLTGVVINVALIAVGLTTLGLREATGEVLGSPPQSKLAGLGQRLRRATWEALETDIHLPPLLRLERRKQLSYIISDEVDAISSALIQEIGRGVTLLHGTGMYTGREHGVLMFVCDARQIDRMKALVRRLDPKAFIVITPAEDVRGFGFRPLEA